MEHSLHQELKRFYGGPNPALEVAIDRYRVDTINQEWLVEIQQGPLWAIRRKTQALLERHFVLVVKPIAVTRHIVRLDGPGGEIISRRRSPKFGHPWDLFGELIHFVTVFPHPHLRIDVALVDIVEYRYPRTRKSWRQPPFSLADREITQLREIITLTRPEDLRLLLPETGESFDTSELAQKLRIPRWQAQQIAYCLRKCGAAEVTGRTRRGWQYRWLSVPPAIPDRLSLLVA